MGLLDSVLGSVLGGAQAQSQAGGGGAAAVMQIVAAMLAERGGGGLAGLAEQFQRGGLGEVMNSWIGTGQNLPISPDQLGGVLGGDVLSRITQHTGMSQDDVLGHLSQILPQMVDKMTPEGQIPAGGLGDIGAILGRFTNPG